MSSDFEFLNLKCALNGAHVYSFKVRVLVFMRCYETLVVTKL